jgi:hypothetical protein
LLIGSALLLWFPMAAGFNPDSGLFLTGIVLIGIHICRHFGKVTMNQRRRQSLAAKNDVAQARGYCAHCTR